MCEKNVTSNTQIMFEPITSHQRDEPAGCKLLFWRCPRHQRLGWTLTRAMRWRPTPRGSSAPGPCLGSTIWPCLAESPPTPTSWPLLQVRARSFPAVDLYPNLALPDLLLLLIAGAARPFIWVSTVVFPHLRRVFSSPSGILHMAHIVRLFPHGGNRLYRYYRLTACLCCFHSCLNPLPVHAPVKDGSLGTKICLPETLRELRLVCEPLCV